MGEKNSRDTSLKYADKCVHACFHLECEGLERRTVASSTPIFEGAVKVVTLKMCSQHFCVCVCETVSSLLCSLK